VAKYNPPYGKEAAPYLYERARMKADTIWTAPGAWTVYGQYGA
jgi:hypothetical protein